jgi:hypothetical protein
MAGSGKSSSSQTTSQTQTTDPYAPTKPILNSLFANLGNVNPNLTGAETGAINELGQTGGNQFAPQIGDVASGLLGGGGAQNQSGFLTDAFNQYKAALDPFASGSYVDPASNPALRGYMDTIASDVGGRVNDMFAGAGRDLSGQHVQAYGRGISQGQAPVLADMYNQERNRQLNAISGIFGGAGTTAGALGDMNAQANQNRAAGVGAADAATAARNSGPLAMIEAEAMKRNIPLQTMAQIMGITLPAAGGLGTTNSWGQSQGEQQKSLAETFATWTKGIGNLFSGGSGGSTPKVV